MGYDALFRLAMVEPNIAQLSFNYLLEKLSLEHQKWLAMVLQMGQSVQRIQIDNRIINAPLGTDPDSSVVGKLTLLYLQWPTLRNTFLEALHQIHRKRFRGYLISGTTTR